MTERYQQEIIDLTVYFAERLPACGPVTLTPEERKAGVDSLGARRDTQLANALVHSACTEWLLTRQYELSYNQVCCAFFAALDAAQSCSHCNLRDCMCSDFDVAPEMGAH